MSAPGSGTITPVFWWKCDAVAGLSDGDPMPFGKWLDSSGSGRNASSVSGTAPVYKTNQLNGQPVARFAGAGEVVLPNMSTNFNFYHTAIVVMKKTGSGAEVVIGSGNDTSDNWLMAFADATTPRVTVANSNVEVSTRALSGFGVMTEVQTTSNCFTSHLFVNGVFAGSEDANYSTLRTQVLAVHIGGYANLLRLNGDVAEVILYDSVLPASEMNFIHTYLNLKYGLSLPTYTMNLIFDGDSITFGSLGYPSQFRNLVAAHYSALGAYPISFGCPSDTLASLNSRYASTIAPMFSSGLTNVFVAFAGTNIAGTDTGAQAYTRAATLISAAQSTGFKVVFPTMLNRSGEETYQAAYNSAIVSGALADAIPQWQNDAAITFGDGIHPDTAGHAQMANPWLYTAIDTFVVPNISYTTPVAGTAGVAISTQSPANTGGASTNWTLDSGSLNGLSLNTTTGAITGTPTAGGTFTPTIKATNAFGNDTFQITFSISSKSGSSSSMSKSSISKSSMKKSSLSKSSM